MSQTGVSIKATNAINTEIRRFSCNSFEELVEELKKFFDCDPQNDRILYLDNEGDWITVGDKNEWNEAIRQLKASVLKVRVEKSSSDEKSTLVPFQGCMAKRFRGGGRHCRRGGRRGCRRGRGKFKGATQEEQKKKWMEKKKWVEEKKGYRSEIMKQKLEWFAEVLKDENLPEWKREKLKFKQAKIQWKLNALKSRLDHKSEKLEKKINSTGNNLEGKISALKEKKEWVESKKCSRVEFLKQKLAWFEGQENDESIPVWRREKIKQKIAKLQWKLHKVSGKLEEKSSSLEEKIAKKEKRLEKKKEKAEKKKEKSEKKETLYPKKVTLLKQMGFEEEKVLPLLREKNGDMQEVLRILLE